MLLGFNIEESGETGRCGVLTPESRNSVFILSFIMFLHCW